MYEIVSHRDQNYLINDSDEDGRKSKLPQKVK